MLYASLVAALDALGRLPSTASENLSSMPAFLDLHELCKQRYDVSARFALGTALRNLGLPCTRSPASEWDAFDPEDAAAAIHRAFMQRSKRRRHICPLDLADTLPPLDFGQASVRTFDVPGLVALFDGARLARLYPGKPLDAARFADFHWLVVEEEIAVDPRPDARSAPMIFTDLRRDFGAVEPHRARFPAAVEKALFFLLLAPWEEWSTLPEVDWRGFRIPWIHTIEDDLFAHPVPPPGADGLSLEPWFGRDSFGKEFEDERPTILPLGGEAEAGLVRFTESAWLELEEARATDLFETPVEHFLLRAFFAEGMDEIMAHMTTIEAALGLEMDHLRGMRPRTDPYRDRSATDRISARIAALLNERDAVEAYKDLFRLRSTFVHGRAGLQPISTTERIRARSLARRVVRALVDLARMSRVEREEALEALLDQGMVMLSLIDTNGSASR